MCNIQQTLFGFFYIQPGLMHGQLCTVIIVIFYAPKMISCHQGLSFFTLFLSWMTSGHKDTRKLIRYCSGFQLY